MRLKIKSLPAAEFTIMEVLWENADMGYSEIIKAAEQNGKSLSVKRIHRLLNQLSEKKLIAVTRVDTVYSTKLKKYSAAVTRKKYLAAVLESDLAYTEKELPDMIACLLSRTKNKETIEKLYKIIRTEKERL